MQVSMAGVTDKIIKIRERLHELDEAAANPDVLRDQARYRDVMRERSRLSHIDEYFVRYEAATAQLGETADMLAQETDPDIRAMIEEEAAVLKTTVADLESTLQDLLAPRDPLADKSVIMEVRAGTGG